MRQPVDYERPVTPDERLEEFELWTKTDQRRRAPEGAIVGYLVIWIGMLFAFVLGAVLFARVL